MLIGTGATGLAALAGCTTDENGENGGEDDSSVPDAVMIVGFPQSGIQLFRDFYSEFESDASDLDIVVPDGLIDSDLPESRRESRRSRRA
jgi:branched-chain amino acid transport system substrate-binding protein